MINFFKKENTDLKTLREDIKTISNDLFDIIKIPFEETTELQRQIIATFAFGMVNSIGMQNKLMPPDVHALTIIMLVECFKYSTKQAVAFADDLISAATTSDRNDTHKAIIHRGIDGHYHYTNGQKDKVGENLLNIIEILEDKQ